MVGTTKRQGAGRCVQGGVTVKMVSIVRSGRVNGTTREAQGEHKKMGRRDDPMPITRWDLKMHLTGFSSEHDGEGRLAEDRVNRAFKNAQGEIRANVLCDLVDNLLV